MPPFGVGVLTSRHVCECTVKNHIYYLEQLMIKFTDRGKVILVLTDNAITTSMIKGDGFQNALSIGNKPLELRYTYYQYSKIEVPLT